MARPKRNLNNSSLRLKRNLNNSSLRLKKQMEHHTRYQDNVRNSSGVRSGMPPRSTERSSNVRSTSDFRDSGRSVRGGRHTNDMRSQEGLEDRSAMCQNMLDRSGIRPVARIRSGIRPDIRDRKGMFQDSRNRSGTRQEGRNLIRSNAKHGDGRLPVSRSINENRSVVVLLKVIQILILITFLDNILVTDFTYWRNRLIL